MSLELLGFGIMLPWLIVGLVCWLGFQLVRQNGRILLRLETVEQALGQLAQLAQLGQPAMPPGPGMEPGPQGLPVGSAAPEFELRDLTVPGGRKSLFDFRGQRVLLIFFNPGCGFCAQMGPDLAALPTDGAAGRPIPLVISSGTPKENRQFILEHGFRCPVLLQKQMEVGMEYKAYGTPMGYLIDEEGRIASEIAVGAEAVLALASGQNEPTAPVNGNKTLAGNRSLADSHIVRNGLPAGAHAPNFRLPRLDGGQLSLDEYRRRRVLLVFSAPECGPCDELAPKLEELSRRTTEVQVLMVSRGEAEANRLKAKENGVTFPVVLQRQWEISREYGMFVTPIAYLIDEQGIIAADMAVGVDAILALLSEAVPSSQVLATNGKAAPASAKEPAGRR